MGMEFHLGKPEVYSAMDYFNPIAEGEYHGSFFSSTTIPLYLEALHSLNEQFDLKVRLACDNHLLDPISSKDSLKLAAALEVDMLCDKESYKERVFVYNAVDFETADVSLSSRQAGKLFPSVSLVSCPVYKTRYSLLIELLRFLQLGKGFWGD